MAKSPTDQEGQRGEVVDGGARCHLQLEQPVIASVSTLAHWNCIASVRLHDRQPDEGDRQFPLGLCEDRTWGPSRAIATLPSYVSGVTAC